MGKADQVMLERHSIPKTEIMTKTIVDGSQQAAFENPGIAGTKLVAPVARFGIAAGVISIVKRQNKDNYRWNPFGSVQASRVAADAILRATW